MYLVLFHIAVIFGLAGEPVQTFGLAMLCLIIAIQDITIKQTTHNYNYPGKPPETPGGVTIKEKIGSEKVDAQM